MSRISFTVTEIERAEIERYVKSKRRWRDPAAFFRDAVFQMMSRYPVIPAKNETQEENEIFVVQEPRNSEERLQQTKGYVYLIRWGDYYKIGVSRKNPHERLAGIIKLPGEAEVINFLYVDYPYKIEKKLHKKYEKERVNGEWFRFQTIPAEFA